MTSISRSVLLAAGLLAFSVAGAVAQSDTGKSTGPSSASAGDKKPVASENGGAAMKSTGSGYENKSEVTGGVGKSPGNAATGQSGKSQ